MDTNTSQAKPVRTETAAPKTVTASSTSSPAQIIPPPPSPPEGAYAPPLNNMAEAVPDRSQRSILAGFIMQGVVNRSSLADAMRGNNVASVVKLADMLITELGKQ